MTKKYLQILAFSILSFSAVTQDVSAGACEDACSRDVKRGDTQALADCIAAKCFQEGGSVSGSVTQEAKGQTPCEDACMMNVKRGDKQALADCIAAKCSQ